MAGPRLRPRAGLTAARHVGYAVFEYDLAARGAARRVRGAFDVIATASRWCEQSLREAGLDNVTTIHCGVDQSRFQPARSMRRRFRDRFVVFSGGKFELRKAQDVVIRAFKIFAERHDDALLIAAWDNPNFQTLKSMKASPHFRLTFDLRDKSVADLLQRWFVRTGLDLDRIERVPRIRNAEMAALYGDTDIGLFPNRCEGGTNLVMMEYMACGRPVIATNFSGHHELITDANSLRLRSWRPSPFRDRGELVGCWCEPDIDEIVACLEQAYSDRDRMARLGERAAADLREWTWERAARRFVDILGGKTVEIKMPYAGHATAVQNL